MKVQIEEAQQAQQVAPPAQPQRTALSTTAYVVNILMGIAFIVAVGIIVGLNMGWISSPRPVAEPAPTVRALPTIAPDPAAPRPRPAQAMTTTVPVEPAVQVDPVAPLPESAPAVQEYIPPAEPIVQPTPDAQYGHTISEYLDRDPCSMPRANPATCAGDVSDLPWPNGRNP